MSFTTQWDDPTQTTVRVELMGEVTIDDARQAFAAVQAMVENKTRVLHIIFHFLPDARFPQGVTPGNLRRLLQSAVENPGMRVFIGAPGLARAIGAATGMLSDRMGVEVRYTDTLDKARAMVLAYRSV